MAISSARTILIVGGGAAGVFAAITCAEAEPGLKILVFERGASPLAKVRISGGGRCNVTHACFDPKELAANYPRGSRELLGPFHTWQPRDMVAWFENRGVKLKTEADGRMFPCSDSSATIVECLLNAARQSGVEIRNNTAVAKMNRSRLGFEIALADGGIQLAERLLIAAGGLKPGPLMNAIAGFGHTVTPLAPSLFTFHVRDARILELSGLSVPNAEVWIPGTPLRQKGPVLITHWGLSGPAILKLSAWAAHWARDRHYQFDLQIDWLGFDPKHRVDQAAKLIEQLRQEGAGRCVAKTSGGLLPSRLFERLVSAAGIAAETKWSQLRRDQAQLLAKQLTQCELAVAGKSLFKEEFVTSGGVDLKEIDFRTMESRLTPGLHFAGEVLDIDAVTGGFNFQAAWTTGRLAGLALRRF